MLECARLSLMRSPNYHADLRRRVAGYLAAAERDRELQRDAPVDPDLAFQQALELCELAGDSLTVPSDAVRLREVSDARAAWARVRKRTAWRQSAPANR
jgi:hypothetical protein